MDKPLKYYDCWIRPTNAIVMLEEDIISSLVSPTFIHLGRSSCPFCWKNGEIPDGAVRDSLHNIDGLVLISERARHIINSCLLGEENITWLPAPVRYFKDQEPITYYILQYNFDYHLLIDKDKTMYGNNERDIIVPFFRREALAKHAIFGNPYFAEPPNLPFLGFKVNETTMKTMRKHKLVGFTFEELTRIVD